jgi:hypothetical protein
MYVCWYGAEDTLHHVQVYVFVTEYVCVCVCVCTFVCMLAGMGPRTRSIMCMLVTE